MRRLCERPGRLHAQRHFTGKTSPSASGSLSLVTMLPVATSGADVHVPPVAAATCTCSQSSCDSGKSAFDASCLRKAHMGCAKQHLT